VERARLGIAALALGAALAGPAPGAGAAGAAEPGSAGDAAGGSRLAASGAEAVRSAPSRLPASIGRTAVAPVELETHEGYNASYIFGMTRGVARSTITPAVKPLLFVLTVPLDIVLLPFAAIGGLFG
jgi:hypothetical protein